MVMENLEKVMEFLYILQAWKSRKNSKMLKCVVKVIEMYCV